MKDKVVGWAKDMLYGSQKSAAESGKESGQN
jgi:hypothetical protein